MEELRVMTTEEGHFNAKQRDATWLILHVSLIEAATRLEMKYMSRMRNKSEQNQCLGDCAGMIEAEDSHGDENGVRKLEVRDSLAERLSMCRHKGGTIKPTEYSL